MPLSVLQPSIDMHAEMNKSMEQTTTTGFSEARIMEYHDGGITKHVVDGNK